MELETIAQFLGEEFRFDYNIYVRTGSVYRAGQCNVLRLALRLLEGDDKRIRKIEDEVEGLLEDDMLAAEEREP